MLETDQVGDVLLQALVQLDQKAARRLLAAIDAIEVGLEQGRRRRLSQVGRELDLQFGSELHTLFSTLDNIENEVLAADLVIGAVLIPGAVAPKLVSRSTVSHM